jgi:cyclic pyranopterin phosphate synthase
MVDVVNKPVTLRQAMASATCFMAEPTARAIKANQLTKGDVLQVARLAAICSAKRTDELIPLCHSLGLDDVKVAFHWPSPTELRIEVQTQATSRTGVEMEAMVGASIAALTVYDMCKSIDREMQIGRIQLEIKSGGSRGQYQRNDRSASTTQDITAPGS